MKIIITEEQYKILSEQSDSKFGLERLGYNPNKPQTLEPAAKKYSDSNRQNREFIQNLDPHTLANIMGVVSLFIPVIGPALSLGIGMADAALYYKEGDKKTAAMLAMFPFLPIGKIAKLVPAVGRLGEKGMGQLAKKLGQEGRALSQVEKEAVEGLSKNKEVFQQDLKNISDDLAKKSQNVGAKSLVDIRKRFFLGECFDHLNCPAIRSIITDFYQNLAPLAKMTKFYPKDVKVLTREIVYPNTKYAREVLEVQVKDGPKFLIYKSSGSNVLTTGKEAGEWFVIPGFAQHGWFVKTPETVNLTKGGNKYLTDMAEFLELNGPNMLGR